MAYASFEQGDNGVSTFVGILNTRTNRIMLSPKNYIMKTIEAGNSIPNNELPQYNLMGGTMKPKELGETLDSFEYRPANSFADGNELIWGLRSGEKALMLIGGSMAGDNSSFVVNFTVSVNDVATQDFERAYWLRALRLSVSGRL